jgi:uncharacterized protein (TIGR01777 family)
MRVFLTGGTGFIGFHLVQALVARGDECVVVSRSAKNPWTTDLVQLVQADPSLAGDWQETLSGVDAVINLAGERIVDPPRRWTAARKKRLRESRVSTTTRIVDGIRKAEQPPSIFLSGSAIGYYGPRGDVLVDESMGPGDDFLALLSQDWEQAALAAEDIVPVTLLRTGIVLGKRQGALASLLPSFKLGLGGPWGSGTQWWSWIHIEDEVGLILLLLDRKLAGAFNLTAPNPVTVNEFAATLGKTLRRPALIRTPAFLLRAGLGEGASALIDLQRVSPKKALERGYQFQFPTLAEALKDLL